MASGFLENDKVCIPINVLKDISSIESRKYIIDRITFSYDTIKAQKIIIAQLSEQVELLQEALLDAKLKNKYGINKMKVKVRKCGRSKMDKNSHRCIR